MQSENADSARARGVRGCGEQAAAVLRVRQVILERGVARVRLDLGGQILNQIRQGCCHPRSDTHRESAPADRRPAAPAAAAHSSSAAATRLLTLSIYPLSQLQ